MAFYNLWSKEELEETREKVFKILDEGFYPYLNDFEFTPEYEKDIKMMGVMLKHKKQGIPLKQVIKDLHERAVRIYHLAHPQYKRPNIEFG